MKRKTQETRAEFKRLRKAARDAKPAPGIGGKQKLEQLFHEVYGQNPRQLPEFTAKQMAAIEKLLRGKTIMAKKRKLKRTKRNIEQGFVDSSGRFHPIRASSDYDEDEVGERVNYSRKKKRNPRKRKGKMPAGLKAYWARKRRAKAKRRNPAKRRAKKPKRRKPSWHKAMAKIGSAKSAAAWMRAMGQLPNPRRRKKARRRRANPIRKAKRITLKGFTASQIRKVASVVRRATGKRVRVVKP